MMPCVVLRILGGQMLTAKETALRQFQRSILLGRFHKFTARVGYCVRLHSWEAIPRERVAGECSLGSILGQFLWLQENNTGSKELEYRFLAPRENSGVRRAFPCCLLLHGINLLNRQSINMIENPKFCYYSEKSSLFHPELPPPCPCSWVSYALFILLERSVDIQSYYIASSIFVQIVVYCAQGQNLAFYLFKNLFKANFIL